MSRVSLVRLEKGRRISEGRLALPTLGDPLTSQPSREVDMAKRNMAPPVGAVHNSEYGNARKADGLAYTIAAIPTLYRGRKYRSRLEAKWAAMFDLLGWQHEYEPYDLGKWSPDFLIRSPTGGYVLVEVKPITEFAPEVGKRMAAAAFAHGLQDEALGYMLLGVAPISIEGEAWQLGWFGQPHSLLNNAEWGACALGWVPDLEQPVLRPDILTYEDHYWSSVLHGDHGKGAPARRIYYPQHAAALWAQASSAVQWKPKA